MFFTFKDLTIYQGKSMCDKTKSYLYKKKLITQIQNLKSN